LHPAAVSLDPAEALGPALPFLPEAAISSWVRPMKFHHINTGSVNGAPPSSITRAGWLPGLASLSLSGPGGR
jgi:hypothetical protein